ncbi:proteasome assembly chaperone family protein [Methanoculleus sp. Wushi-C6]|uniref:Proteasome assembly chaperone family protein n=1 Tax=Methanoculleus caldifontis TaxID=2651577 RepID=A0ABU3WZN3_9EURY|nr:proteasome assembly chaperone family protein [Methanoculleus sp. Wushi-C6]MDV2480636.1 proteasome assembly chaperone family protein [Methanoculleus sp. Wushi-C6]
MEHVTVNFLRDDDLDAPVLIEGLPGIGHVGKLVAEHLIHELKAEKVAEISSLHFPPHVIVDEHGITHLVNNEIYRYERDGKATLFLVGDFQSNSAEGHYILAESYLDIAEELGVRRVYALGGYGVGHLVERPRVLSAVNMEHLRAEVEAAGGSFENAASGGMIVGASGLLLGLGEARGIEGICLMGETSGYIVDPKSADSLLSVLSRLTGIEVDHTSLQQRAADMEQIIANIQEAEEAKGREELSYIG